MKRFDLKYVKIPLLALQWALIMLKFQHKIASWWIALIPSLIIWDALIVLCVLYGLYLLFETPEEKAWRMSRDSFVKPKGSQNPP